MKKLWRLLCILILMLALYTPIVSQQKDWRTLVVCGGLLLFALNELFEPRKGSL